MQNITTGHWIFAGIFMTFFIGFLIWSYLKDNPTHQKQYSGSIYFVLGFITLAFLIFIFARIF